MGNTCPPYIPLGLGTCVTTRSSPIIFLTHRRRAIPTSSLNPSWWHSCYAVPITTTLTLAVYPPPPLLPSSPFSVSSVFLFHVSSPSSVFPPFAPASASLGSDSYVYTGDNSYMYKPLVYATWEQFYIFKDHHNSNILNIISIVNSHSISVGNVYRLFYNQ